MGFCEALTIIFVILKATNIVNWSWWIVFIPMYPALILYAFLLLLFVIGLLVTIFNL